MKKYKGNCLCGDIQFVLTGEPKDPHLCYCNMCQNWSGAPVVAWVSFPIASLAYTKGKPTLFRSSKETQRGFCNRCGSNLFALNDESETICMTIPVLENKCDIVPEFESFKESSPKWLQRHIRKEKL